MRLERGNTYVVCKDGEIWQDLPAAGKSVVDALLSYQHTVKIQVACLSTIKEGK